MKYIKTINEFLATNEQLFGPGIKKIAKELFGGKDGSSDNEGTTKPTGEMGATKSLGDLGKFTEGASKDSPLVVVYGGVDVGGRKSGEYMYDYFKATGNAYNLFIARDAKIDGKKAYEEVKSKLEKDGINPSKKVLYLFSGGWGPGKKLLESVGAKEFDRIYLVDIWMGDDNVSSFYKKIASDNKEKVEYYYTSSGASNTQASDSLASLSSVSLKNKDNNHMDTNKDALVSLTTKI